VIYGIVEIMKKIITMIKYNIMIENLIISINAFFNKKNKNISRVKEHMSLDLINTLLIKQDDTIHKK
jgi:hypothetical protein